MYNFLLSRLSHWTAPQAAAVQTDRQRLLLSTVQQAVQHGGKPTSNSQLAAPPERNPSPRHKLPRRRKILSFIFIHYNTNTSPVYIGSCGGGNEVRFTLKSL